MVRSRNNIQSSFLRHPLAHWGLAGLAALLSGGCVSSTQNLAGSPLGLSRNYPIDSPAAQNGNKKPNSRLHLAYAKLKESEGDAAEARKSYQQVLAENPKSTDAILGIARLDQLAGRNEAAEKGLKRALTIEPKSALVLDSLGQFYSGLGRWDEATRSLSEAVRNAPGEKTYQHHLAVTLAKSGRIEESLPYFAQAVGPAAAHYNVGLILHEKGEIKASEAQFVQAIMKDPKLEQAQYWIEEIRREQESQFASSDVPAGPATNAFATNSAAGSSFAGSASAGNFTSENSTASHQQLRPPAFDQRIASTGPASAQSATAPAFGPPRITAGPIQQDAQGWPGTKPPVASQPMKPAQRTPTVEQFATRNRAGTMLLPAPEGAPSGVTAQQWEQWNNQRSPNNGPVASNFGDRANAPR